MTMRSGRSPGRGGDGWNAIVAIADVSFYVRPGSALDREALLRGNSVYFPDRVVPMLPEELSADICSLKAGEDRAALACHLHVSKDGTLKAWRFTRAKIRVAANIAYEDAQAAIDAANEERIEVSSPTCAMPRGRRAGFPSELVDGALKPLWACWRALFTARHKRGPLELDLPERQVVLDEKGRIASVAPRDRLDAHRLVEDYMIAANVAAARALEAKKMPVMYRIHEPPSREKLVALKDYLGDLRRRIRAWPGGQPRRFSTASSNGSATATAGRKSWSNCCARKCRRATGPNGSAISVWRWRPTPISPRRSDAMPTLSSTADWFALMGSARAGFPPGEEDAARRDRRENLDARAARDGGRARNRRPLCRRLSVRPRRPVGRMPGDRNPELRAVRDGRGSGRRRAAVRARSRQRIFPLRRGGEIAGRRRKRRDVSNGAAADAQACRGQSGHRRASLRTPRGKLWRQCGPPRRDRVRTPQRRGRPPNIRHSNRRP